jgi:hypothetical protein
LSSFDFFSFVSVLFIFLKILSYILNTINNQKQIKKSQLQQFKRTQGVPATKQEYETTHYSTATATSASCSNSPARRLHTPWSDSIVSIAPAQPAAELVHPTACGKAARRSFQIWRPRRGSASALVFFFKKIGTTRTNALLSPPLADGRQSSLPTHLGHLLSYHSALPSRCLHQYCNTAAVKSKESDEERKLLRWLRSAPACMSACLSVLVVPPRYGF